MQEVTPARDTGGALPFHPLRRLSDLRDPHGMDGWRDWMGGGIGWIGWSYCSPSPVQMGWLRFWVTHIPPAQGSPTPPQFWSPGTFLSPAVPALCPAASQVEQGCLRPLKGILGVRIARPSSGAQSNSQSQAHSHLHYERSLEAVENKVHETSLHGLGLT